MLTLNLVYPEKSDIKYKISKFPDGQQQINILLQGIQTLSYEKNYHYGVIIKSRLNNFSDLELIICATKSLRELMVEKIHLFTPYFLGSRSDRKFEEGSNNYLKDVICPIINSLNFKTVTCIDPHSDVLEACLNGFRKESNLKLVNAFTDSLWNNGECVLISPDAGASKKIYKLAEKIGYKGDIITCSKNRDTKGKLTKTYVPLEDTYEDKEYIIIDDICDGGTTFINIAKYIREEYKMYNSKQPKIYLMVTHGIFSKGFGELSKYFDGIYCTNSYKDILDTTILCSTTSTKRVGELVKQLNIF